MKRFLILSLLIGGSTVALFASQGQGQGTKSDTLKLSEVEQKVLDLTNEARKKENLPALKPNLLLFNLARNYSQKMAKHQKADHDLEGTKLRDRIKASGYVHHIAGENLGKSEGNFPVEKLFQGWMDSKLHRDNILEKAFTEIGLGIVTDEKGNTWYTQVFAVPFKAKGN